MGKLLLQSQERKLHEKLFKYCNDTFPHPIQVPLFSIRYTHPHKPMNNQPEHKPPSLQPISSSNAAQDRRVATLLALLDRLAPSVRAQIKARIEALDAREEAVRAAYMAAVNARVEERARRAAIANGEVDDRGEE